MSPPEGQEVVNIRIPTDMHRALARLAADEDRTLSATIRVACRRYLIDSGWVPDATPRSGDTIPQEGAQDG